MGPGLGTLREGDHPRDFRYKQRVGMGAGSGTPTPARPSAREGPPHISPWSASGLTLIARNCGDGGLARPLWDRLG